jgi:hypothetical protein
MKHENSFESKKYEVLFTKGDLHLESWNKGAVFLMRTMKNGPSYCLGEFWNFKDAKAELESLYEEKEDDFPSDENFGDECYVAEYYRGEYE